MNWLKPKKEELYDRFPDVEFKADGFDSVYRIKYTECIKERSGIRFERKEKIISKEKINEILMELLG